MVKSGPADLRTRFSAGETPEGCALCVARAISVRVALDSIPDCTGLALKMKKRR